MKTTVRVVKHARLDGPVFPIPLLQIDSVLVSLVPDNEAGCLPKGRACNHLTSCASLLAKLIYSPRGTFSSMYVLVEHSPPRYPHPW